MTNTTSHKLSIDGVEYEIEQLSPDAQAQVANLQFVDAKIQKLQSELAIADTARLAYGQALKNELNKIDE